MAKYWIKKPGIRNIASTDLMGPLDEGELLSQLASGRILPSYEALEATGLTMSELQQSNGWTPLSVMMPEDANFQSPSNGIHLEDSEVIDDVSADADADDDDDGSEADSQSDVRHQRRASPIIARYRDGYRVGTGLVALGGAIKVLGAIVTGLALLLSLNLGPFAVAGIFVGVISGGLTWICGVIVSSHGQSLRATLDTAVSSSRFLSDAECAEAMGLPAKVLRLRE